MIHPKFDTALIVGAGDGISASVARLFAAHFVIDGGVGGATRIEPAGSPDPLLDPDAIAKSYLNVPRQPRNAWTLEIELRPWVERF